MEASDLVHEESSYCCQAPCTSERMGDGKNLHLGHHDGQQAVHANDASTTSTKRVMSTTGIFVDIPVEVECTAGRMRVIAAGHENYRSGQRDGRPIRAARGDHDPRRDTEWGSATIGTFEEVKHSFVDWAVYDNSVDGREPETVAS